RAVAEGAAPLTAVVIAAQAGGAGGAGGGGAAQDPVAHSHPLDLGTGGEHRADELVPDREAGLDRHPPVVDVEVGAANPARLDPHQGVVVGNDLRIGLLLDPNFAGSLKSNRAHDREPYRPKADGPETELYVPFQAVGGQFQPTLTTATRTRHVSTPGLAVSAILASSESSRSKSASSPWRKEM